MTATRTRKARKPHQRTLSFNSLTGILHLKQDGKETGYYVDRLACDFGSAYRLSKVIARPGEPDHYDVLISPDGFDNCECKGYQRWAHCKHVAALRCLCQRGSLS